MMIRQASAGVRAGSALVTAMVVTMVLGVVALTFMTVSARHEQESASTSGELTSFYAADAGLSAAYVELQNGGDGVLGDADHPVEFGGLRYWTTADAVDAQVTSLVATGTDGNHQSQIEMLVKNDSSEITDFGIFGKKGVSLKSNSKIDSYNSALGTYASQLNGAYAHSNGNVGSNDSISVASNTKVYGYAQYGPDVGDSISVAANVSISDGYGPAKTAVVLAPIVVPSYANSGALTLKAKDNKTIGPGNVQYDTITTASNSSLTVKGPCNLVISSAATINSNSTWKLDASGGPIVIYAKKDFELKSNATVSTTTTDPTKLTLYLSGVHANAASASPKIDFSSNSTFYGTVYAPNLAVTISSNFELFGSLKASWLTIASNAKLHFDEKLAAGALDPGSGYSVVAWRPLTGQQAPTE